MILAVNPQHAMVLAAMLFALGLLGVLVRRNLLFVLLSVEIMLNASGLAFIAAGALWAQADGQAMFLFILAMAAAEAAVGLALVLAWYRQTGSLNADAMNQLKDEPNAAPTVTNA